MIRPETAWSVDQIIDWVRQHPWIGDQANIRQTLRSTYPSLNPDLPQPLSPPKPVGVGLSPKRQQSPPSDSMMDLNDYNDRNKNAGEEKESNRFHQDLTMRTHTTANNDSWAAKRRKTAPTDC